MPSPALTFLRANAPWLAAGAALTLSSSFGQTFFISVFAGEIRAEFDLSHGQWGGIYTLGTLASAILMFFVGGITDRHRIRRIGIVFLIALAVMCIAMAAVPAAWALPLVIFGLRFCGQGMLSHTATVGVGRWFTRNRGRANAIVSMGFLTGEGLLPVIFVLIMSAYGWRVSWVVAAAAALMIVPALMAFLRREREPRSDTDTVHEPGMYGRHWTRRDVLSHWLFWIMSLGVVAPATFGTAYFFQQVHLTDLKGWSLTGFVALLPVYTATSLGAMFLFGALADRFGTARIIPVYLLPMAAAFVLASVGPSLWWVAGAFALLGLTQGANNAIGGTFWPEYYGTRNLGSVRVMGTSVMVFGSAIGPGVTGFLIDAGVDYRTQLIWMSVYLVIVSAILAVALTKARHFLP